MTGDAREALALKALRLHDEYAALPADRGGANGRKGKAQAAWLAAKAAALASSPSPAGGDVREALDAAMRDAFAGGTGVTITRIDPAALASSPATTEIAPVAVKVKPLEWHRSHVDPWNGDYHTVPTAYCVRCADEDGWKWSSGQGAFGYKDSPEAAQQAAQNYHERRILSAIEAQPVTAIQDTLNAKAAELERLREALTPSADTKEAYIGEFRFNFPIRDHNGDDRVYTPNVPWTTIKEIMAAIRARAALKEKTDGQPSVSR